MTRPELAAAIRELPEDEKLELLSELWDALDHFAPVPDWHKEELDARLASANVGIAYRLVGGEGANPRLEVILVLRREAEADIQEAFRWYESKQPGLGHAFVEVETAHSNGSRRPPSSYPVAYRDLRRLVLRRFPYVLYFRQVERRRPSVRRDTRSA